MKFIMIRGFGTVFVVVDSVGSNGAYDCAPFVAVTGRSETNILAAMLAKRMGVKKVIAEVENINYISLAESIGVDTIINKKLVTASNIFRFTMTTDVQAVKCLTGSQAEVMEFVVKPNSAATKGCAVARDWSALRRAYPVAQHRSS